MDNEILDEGTRIKIIFSEAWHEIADQTDLALVRLGLRPTLKNALPATITEDPCRILYCTLSNGTRSQAEYLKGILAEKVELEVEKANFFSPYQYIIVLAQLTSQKKVKRALQPKAHTSPSKETLPGHINVPVSQLPFELLPPGSWDIDDLISHYRREAKNLPTGLSGREIQWARLTALKSLEPIMCYVGTEMWLGYILFEFPNSARVVLECPIEGNATYVLSGNWKTMVKHTKGYLRSKFPRRYKRIVHKGNWLERVGLSLNR